jgi:transcriptional regulator with XRE-family HTH domain
MPDTTEKRKIRKPSKRLLKVLSQNIRAFRKIKSLSQEELADMCKLHRTYIGSVERGERNVTLSTLEAIATVLGVSVPKLLTERGIGDD